MLNIDSNAKCIFSPKKSDSNYLIISKTFLILPFFWWIIISYRLFKPRFPLVQIHFQQWCFVQCNCLVSLWKTPTTLSIEYGGTVVDPLLRSAFAQQSAQTNICRLLSLASHGFLFWWVDTLQQIKWVLSTVNNRASSKRNHGKYFFTPEI